MLKTAWGGIYPDPPYNACTDFDRNLSVDHGDLVILKQNFITVCPADPNCPEWTGGVPPTGKVEYWDLFAVSLSPAGMYWDLVNGGAGSLADPLVSPDPAGNRVIDNTTPLEGIAYGFGGAAWEDGLLESDSNTYSIELMGAADYYLSVVLDTNTTPQQDGYVPSWGTISDIVVRPWDPCTWDWGDPCVVNWTISPYDPDGGTVVIGGASSTVTLASNDFLKGEMDMQDLATPGIWGAAVELPPAPGYKVTFTTDVHTWDTYHGLGHEAQIPWEIVSDDFRCFGTMPVTSVHWWGSHLGWEERDPPPVEPIAWRIGFWSNVPADPIVDPCYSHPDTLLWQIEVDADRVDCNWVGNDWFPDMMPEACFQYNVQFEPNEYFWQDHYVTQDKTFWISIAAVYPIGSPPVDFPWGWKTRPWSWMDDAVTFNLDESPWIGMALYPWSVTPIEDPLYGESFDLAFELDTDPCYVKWEQAYDSIRHWPHYEDEQSMATINRWTDTKWQQQPDPSGWDVCVSGWRLADDWPCDETGPVSDIHFWVSWEFDDPGQILSVDVEIYTDSPAVPPGHSEPNELKWSRSFSATELSIVQYGTGDQGWLEPDHFYWNRPDHLGYYLINIDNITDPFIQEQGNIYWLSIEVNSVDSWVGWKTSSQQWNDDAVYKDPSTGEWRELHDPDTGVSLDLAFAITTEKEELDFSALVADDWPCDDNAPVTAAAWWGSYIGYGYEACQGPPANRPTEPDYFWLTIWDDVPDPNPFDPTDYSHPNNIIWKYDAYDYDEVLVGYDKHPHGEPNEPVFRYSVRIPEEDWFCQNEPNNVYWFSIVAVYEDVPAYNWGWTNHKHVYNDDAVTGYPDISGPVPIWSWFELYDQNDASEDMSFILFTEPDCFPKTDPKYNQWVLQGKPRAWCCKYQSLGDVTGDGASNIFDLFAFRTSYGKSYPNPGYDCRADLNHDGAVNIFDLFIFRANYGILFERRYSCPWKDDCGPHPCP